MLLQGVTHVSQMVQYPADPSTDTPTVWVAHFAHPIEAEWIARSTPAPKDWPKVLLQVNNGHNSNATSRASQTTVLLDAATATLHPSSHLGL